MTVITGFVGYFIFRTQIPCCPHTDDYPCLYLPITEKKKLAMLHNLVIGSNKFNAHLVEKGLYLVEIN